MQFPSTDFLDAPPFPLNAWSKRATPPDFDLYASAISCIAGSFGGAWANERGALIAASNISTDAGSFTPSFY